MNKLVVDGGSTLDLNGKHLYVRAAQINGQIVGGTVTFAADGGLLGLTTATPGSIGVVGEQDDWIVAGIKGAD